MNQLIKDLKEQLEKDKNITLESKVNLAKELFFLEEAYNNRRREENERGTWATFIYLS